MQSVVIKQTDRHSLVTVAELPTPRLTRPEQVLIQVLSVGLDGTDKEIILHNYAKMPPGSRQMIIGHELLGVVKEAGIASGFSPGDLVTCLVRKPCEDPSCDNCRHGRQDFCETGKYIEHGIKELDGFLCEYVVEDAKYVVKVPDACRQYGVLIEPQSIVEKVWNQARAIQQRMVWRPKTALVLGSGPLGILAALTCRVFGLDVYVWSQSDPQSRNAMIIREIGGQFQHSGTAVVPAAGSKANGSSVSGLPEYAERLGKRFDIIWECSGHAPLGFESIPLLNCNGILALLGVSPGDGSLSIPSDLINQEMVVKNKCVIGSVNASRHDFTTAIARLQEIAARFPGVLGKLMASRVPMKDVPNLDFSTVEIKAIVDLA